MTDLFRVETLADAVFYGWSRAEPPFEGAEWVKTEAGWCLEVKSAEGAAVLDFWPREAARGGRLCAPLALVYIRNCEEVRLALYTEVSGVLVQKVFSYNRIKDLPHAIAAELKRAERYLEPLPAAERLIDAFTRPLPTITKMLIFTA